MCAFLSEGVGIAEAGRIPPSRDKGLKTGGYRTSAMSLCDLVLLRRSVLGGTVGGEEGPGGELFCGRERDVICEVWATWYGLLDDAGSVRTGMAGGECAAGQAPFKREGGIL